MSSNTSDAFNSIETLVGFPPIMQGSTEITFEHIMKRIKELESKKPSIEKLDKLDDTPHIAAGIFVEENLYIGAIKTNKTNREAYVRVIKVLYFDSNKIYEACHKILCQNSKTF